jgi:endonuclease YncB( thermonuclease family)
MFARNVPLLCLLALGQAAASTLTGQVVGVSDGDTITVLDADHQSYKIRLSGIDAPEKKQPFGQRSKQHLSTLVFGREVDVIWNKHDRYKRIVGQVMVTSPSCVRPTCPKADDAGLRQIEAGMAWWYRKYAREQAQGDAADYDRAETRARSRRVGLWSEPNPVPPWDWRRAVRQ